MNNKITYVNDYYHRNRHIYKYLIDTYEIAITVNDIDNTITYVQVNNNNAFVFNIEALPDTTCYVKIPSTQLFTDQTDAFNKKLRAAEQTATAIQTFLQTFKPKK